MSFSSDITINDGTSDHVYSQISLESSKSVRSDATKTLALPSLLTISHTVAGSGNMKRDRHLVRIDDVFEDDLSETGGTVTGSTYIVIDHPRRVVTEAQMTLQIEQIKSFLTTANLTKIFNGEP